MMDSGSTISKRVTALKSGPMAQCMKETMLQERKMARVNLCGRTKVPTLVSLLIMSSTDRVTLHGLTGGCTRDNG